MLDVPAGADGSAQVPITIVHGAMPGPALALVAGNHGCEYPPILALQRLRNELDPRRIRGTVVMTLAVGEGAFVALAPSLYLVEAPLTLLTVAALRDPGLALIGAASDTLTFDLGTVPEGDSAGLALLIDWLASAHARSLKLHYANPGRTLLALARLSEVEPLLIEGERPAERKSPAETTLPPDLTSAEPQS